LNCLQSLEPGADELVGALQEFGDASRPNIPAAVERGDSGDGATTSRRTMGASIGLASGLKVR
jgi:hypothetical protein